MNIHKRLRKIGQELAKMADDDKLIGLVVNMLSDIEDTQKCVLEVVADKESREFYNAVVKYRKHLESM